MKTIDGISLWLARIGALLLFFTGAFLTFEVVARYVFHAPTSWAQELAELCLLWGVFLALGRLVLKREHIAIEMLYERLNAERRRALDALSLAFVFAFLVFVTVYGYAIAAESIARGTMTGTMLNIPSWCEELAVPVGAAWAAVQTLVEIVRAVTGRGWANLVNQGSEP